MHISEGNDMGFWALFVLAVGLSMDAFAVSICKGLAQKKLTLKNMGIVGLWFGGFQALMPLVGYFLGYQFRKQITSIDHWIAFVLLVLIGGNMIREALSSDDDSIENSNENADGNDDSSLGVKTMFLMAVATSIDALAVGVTFAFLNVNIVAAVSLIGVTTFVLSCVGVKVGNVFGLKYKSKAEIAGGVILILLGIKILLEHLKIF